MHTVVRRLSPGIAGKRIAAAVALVCSALVAAAAATAGYGPTIPPGPPVPGGFSTVVASKTFGRSGGRLVARSGKTRFVLQIPRGALKSSTQFTLTRPRLRKLRHRVPRGTHPTIGFALLARHPSGRFVRGTFGSKSVRLTIVDRKIVKRSIALSWNQKKRRFVRYGATITAGRARLAVSRIHEFIVASPA
jgi:hypothetical protein